ncbi:hypothetical protein ASF43_10820 [Pseudorhodoferax sp. Leaf267]|nr:hypothetical protein ASF43_10820 [Pseudorhodoferax sp. Leaf267]
MAWRAELAKGFPEPFIATEAAGHSLASALCPRHVRDNAAMSAADFLLSPAVQAILKLAFSEPARAFAADDFARQAKLALPEVEATLAHLASSGVLVQADTADDQPPAWCANTAFVFYAELRRIALKSFAAAEPLRAMLRSKFKGQVERAFLLGEDPATQMLSLLIVHGEDAPDKAVLDQALKKLIKSRAIHQHVHALVMPATRFDALKAGDNLLAQLAVDTCIDISPSPQRKPATKAAATQPVGLLEKARRRLAGLTRA